MSLFDEMIAAYQAGPDQLASAISGMSDQQLRARPIPGKWSTHEIVCHIADFEIINSDRITRVIAEDKPTIFNAEPEPFAANLNYAGRNTQQQLQLIAALRLHVTTILHSLSADQWQRTGNHSTDGPLTVKQLLGRVTIHIPHHLPFIAAKRAAMQIG